MLKLGTSLFIIFALFSTYLKIYSDIHTFFIEDIIKILYKYFIVIRYIFPIGALDKTVLVWKVPQQLVSQSNLMDSLRNKKKRVSNILKYKKCA